jgi:preprotein translocase subunit SecA
MRKVESDIYLQVLDNLWMQHLEEMDHLREGIGWISVGQRDPLVEYRRQAQILFETMQGTLRHDVLKALFSAEPLRDEDIVEPIETELTKAARHSIENADKIIENEEFKASDFKTIKSTASPVVRQRATIKKTNTKKKTKLKSRKAERKRRAKGRRR